MTNEYLSSFSPKSNFYFIRLFVSDSLTGLVHKRKVRVMAVHSISSSCVLYVPCKGMSTNTPRGFASRGVSLQKSWHDYGVGVAAGAVPLQVNSRRLLEAPAVVQIGLPWSSVPVWRTVTTHQRMAWG